MPTDRHRGNRARRWISALLLALASTASLGCGSTPDAKVVRGEQYVSAASATMRSGGVVFAAYVDPLYGAEGSREYLRCIQAVNEAVFSVLSPHVAVQEGSTHVSPRTRMPLWVRGLAGPRLALNIQSFRCGDVVGDTGYTRVQPPREEEVKSSKRRGEVVLTVHDRLTGNAVVSVVGTAVDPDGAAAVRAAARTAAQRLLGVD
jgi:hypothetical protein